MAQFYAEIIGSRGPATRMGTKESGLSGHLRGWNIGVRVYLGHVNGKDTIEVYRTEGSNNGRDGDLLVRLTED